MARTKITPVFLSLILCFIAALVIVQSKFNTASAVEMIAPVLILVAVKTLDLLYLTMWEYLALLSLLIIEMLKIPPVNTSLFLIFFLVDLCLIIFFHYKKFSANGFNISITVILCTVIYIGFSLTRVKFLGHLYDLISEYNWNTFVKMTFILLYGLLSAGITCMITLMTKKIINIKRRCV